MKSILDIEFMVIQSWESLRKKDRKEGILMFNFLNSESLWIGTDMKKLMKSAHN